MRRPSLARLPLIGARFERRGSGIPLPAEPGPRRTKPRLKKLRFLVVLMGLALLAIVSWVFGIMLAVNFGVMISITGYFREATGLW